MSETTTVSFRTDAAVKEAARELFADLGMDMSTAINIFLRQAITENGIPFQITREDPRSALARSQALKGEGERFNSVDELMDDLLDT